MPNIFEYFGLIFFFHSNDHEPVHVHVKYSGCENKLEFVYSNGKVKDILIKRVIGKRPLPDSILKKAIRFSTVNAKSIAEKWVVFYVKKKKPSFERITRKV